MDDREVTRPMTDILDSPASSGPRAGRLAALLHGTRFDLVYALLATWLLGGLYLDGWAHNHLAETLESFITPWHGVFYAGFGATAALMVGVTLARRREGVGWRTAVPAGYAPSFAGMGLFAIGGVADSVWHTLFGIEVSVDALVSPPHLLLALGLGLIVAGPLGAAWRRAAAPRGIDVIAPLLSLTLTLSLLTFFTQFTNPFSEAWSIESTIRDHAPLMGGLPESLTDDITPVIGVASILLQAGLLMGTILPVVRRWTLPIGSLTVLLGLNVLLVSFMNDQQRLIPAALAAGLAADLLAMWLRPSEDRRALVLFGAAVPAILYLLYFATLLIIDRVIWPGTLVLGSIALAGIVGGLVALVVSASESHDLGSTRDSVRPA